MERQPSGAPGIKRAVFGCGCFWTKEHLFSQLPGVVATQTGYAGGHLSEPNYLSVCRKTSGHAEVVAVDYDPSRVSYNFLLRAFFSFHDATVDRRPGGGQYRSIILATDTDQLIMAQAALNLLQEAAIPVTTELVMLDRFWPAEQRHQGFVRRTGHHRDKKPRADLDALDLLRAARCGISGAPSCTG